LSGRSIAPDLNTEGFYYQLTEDTNPNSFSRHCNFLRRFFSRILFVTQAEVRVAEGVRILSARKILKKCMGIRRKRGSRMRYYLETGYPPIVLVSSFVLQ